MYTKKMAIEDPFSLKQSLSRNLLTQTNKYIINVFSKSCLYFVMNTHCYTDPTNLDPKEERCKIVDKLVAETGILDAKKTNCEFDEDYEDLDEADVEPIDNNGDEANNLQAGDSLDDDEDDLFYFNKTKKTKYKNSSATAKRTSKKSESESVGKLSKEVDVLLKIKIKSLSAEHLEQNPSPFLSLETGSSASTTPIQENESDDVEVEVEVEDEEAEQNLDDDDSEKFTQEEEDDEETDDNEADEIEAEIDSDECDELFFEQDNLDNKNSLNGKFSSDEFELAAKNCLICLIKRVVEINESFYEPIPNVMLIRTSTSKSYNNYSNNQTKNQQGGTNGFRFSSSSLGFAKSPPLICTLCNKDGHLQVDCPQDRLPKLEDLPNMTDQWKEVLNKVCICIMGNYLFSFFNLMIDWDF